jgi:hypothetical protein
MLASEAFSACRASSACKKNANEKKMKSRTAVSEAASWSRQCY